MQYKHVLDCNWVGSLDFNFLGNPGGFNWAHKQLNFLQRSQQQPSVQTSECWYTYHLRTEISFGENQPWCLLGALGFFAALGAADGNVSSWWFPQANCSVTRRCSNHLVSNSSFQGSCSLRCGSPVIAAPLWRLWKAGVLPRPTAMR